jgi:hypothetical protein
MESTKLPRPEMIPSWKRNLSLTTPSPGGRLGDLVRSPRLDNLPGSPIINPSQAIGWSLTGTTNSPSSNLTFLYQNMNGDQSQPQPPPPHPPAPGNMIYDPIRQSLPEVTAASTSTSYDARFQPYPAQRHNPQHMPPPAPKYTPISSDPATTSDAEMLLGLQNSPYAQTPGSHHSYDQSQNITSPSNSRQDPTSTFDFTQNGTHLFSGGLNGYMVMGGVGDMMMESQEIDMSALDGDMMPWLEYLPQDVLNFFDNGNGTGVPPGAH